MNDDFRYRFKSKPKLTAQTNSKKRRSNPVDSGSSIFGIWEDQHRIQAEDDKMAKELAETKRKAKELKRTLRKNQYGETKNTVKEVFTKGLTKLKVFYVNNKRKSITTSIVAVILITSILFWPNGKSNQNSTLGVSEETFSSDGSVDVVPEFNLLYPAGKNEANLLSVTRKTPDGTIIHTYKDVIGSLEIELTQQALPDKIKTDQENQLFELAKSFNATNVIQIDEQKVYTGIDDATGIQSLFTVKDDKLILIKSSQQISDDQWAAYILSLN